MPDASEVEVAWLAGLLEGEGSFLTLTDRQGGREYRYPKVTVNMTDRDVIERVASLFGTSVYDLPIYQKGRKPSFRAQIAGAKAAEWMRLLRPWMGQRRRDSIDAVLAEYGARELTGNAEAAARRPRVGGRFVAR